MKLSIALQSLMLAALSLTLWSQSARSQTTNPDSETVKPLGPTMLFRNISPSVFVVESLDENGSVVALGSGVAVRPMFEEFLQHRDSTFLITNTHVIDQGVSLRVRNGNETWPAQIEHIQLHTDLCRLRIDGLNTPGAELRSSKTLAVGERVYSVGAPEGLELTMSEGLISGLRELDGENVIQTTAAISHGSSGGGLFDAEGKLVGITTFMFSEGQNLNFALPVDTVLEPATSFDNDLIERQSLPARNYSESVQIWGKPEIDTDLANIGSAERLIEKNPDNANAHAILGDRLLLIHDSHRALRELNEAVHLGSNEDGLEDDLGSALDRVGDPYGSARELRNAERIAPDEIDPHFQLTNVLLELNDTKGSLHEVQEVARLRHRWLIPETFVPVAESMARDGDSTSGLAVCDEIKSNVDDPRAEPDNHYCRGAVLLSGTPPNINQAIVELRQAVHMEAKWPEYHNLLGRALEMRGTGDEALAEYKAAYDLYPENSSYKAAYERKLSQRDSESNR